MAAIEQRIAALEGTVNKGDYRPLPRSYFYGEELPEDFYTNPKYVRNKPGTRDEFYGRTDDTQTD